MKDEGKLLAFQRRMSNGNYGEGQILADGFLRLGVTLERDGNFYVIKLCAFDEETNLLLDLNKIQLCWRCYER